jgi:NTP pyrophosphatase (non-canonical NTP hydrolase)
MNEFMNAARQFAVFPLDNSGLDYLASALPEEVGEFSGILAKAVRKGQGRDLTQEQKNAALSELSDILWNVAVASYVLGSSLDAVAHHNINKLEERKRTNTIEGSGETIAERLV